MIGQSISSAGFKSIYRTCDAFLELKVLIGVIIFVDENSLRRGWSCSFLERFSQMNNLQEHQLPLAFFSYAKL